MAASKEAMRHRAALQHISKTTGFADIKNIAVARLMLDNIPHIKAYWVMMTPTIWTAPSSKSASTTMPAPPPNRACAAPSCYS